LYKTIRHKKLINFIKSHGSKLIVTEDHYKEGGIGESISAVLINSGIKMKHLYVKTIPHSGNSEQLLERYGINANHIAKESLSFIV